MKRLLAIAAIATMASACITGSARIRSQDQYGGVLVLVEDEGEAMKDANKKMAQHCGANNYRIVKRETVKVGEENYSNSSTDYGERTDRSRQEDSAAVAASSSSSQYDRSTVHDGYGSDTMVDRHDQSSAAAASSTREDEVTQTSGGSTTSSVSGVRDVNEIRVHYQCGGAAPMAPAPAAAGDQAMPQPGAPAGQPAPVGPPPPPAPAPAPVPAPAPGGV